MAARLVLMAVPAAITMAALAATSEQAWSMTLTEAVIESWLSEAGNMDHDKLVAPGFALSGERNERRMSLKPPVIWGMSD